MWLLKLAEPSETSWLSAWVESVERSLLFPLLDLHLHAQASLPTVTLSSSSCNGQGNHCRLWNLTSYSFGDLLELWAHFPSHDFSASKSEASICWWFSFSSSWLGFLSTAQLPEHCKKQTHLSLLMWFTIISHYLSNYVFLKQDLYRITTHRLVFYEQSWLKYYFSMKKCTRQKNLNPGCYFLELTCQVD